MHQIERFVDGCQPHRVRDKRCKLDAPGHGIVHHAGQLRAPLDATKGSAEPAPTGDELEGPRGDLLTRTSDADHDRLAPSAMRAFERGAHDVDVADALEAVIYYTTRHPD